MKLKTLLHEFSKKRHLKPLDPDYSGKCRIVINDTLFVTFEPSLLSGGFFVYSMLCKVPPERELELLKVAMSGNLFFRETGRSSIGYHESSRAFCFFHYFEEGETSYAHFERQFEEYLEYLAYWKARLEQELSKEPPIRSKEQDLGSKEKKVFFV